MRLNLKFRERVNQVGSWMTTELDQILMAIRGSWLVEHTEDDSHSDIHAYSITLTKDGNTGKTGNVTAGGDVTAGGIGRFGGDVTANFDKLLTSANLSGPWESKFSGVEGNASVLGPSINIGRSTDNYAWQIVANTLKGATPGAQASLEFIAAKDSSAKRRAMRLTQADTPVAGEYYLVGSVPGKLYIGATTGEIGDQGAITRVLADAFRTTEKGTWTPAVNINGSTAGITYSVQNGFYTRYSDRVIVTFNITLTNKGASVGAVTITGLPVAGVGGTTVDIGACQATANCAGLTAPHCSVNGTTLFLLDTQASNVAQWADTNLNNTSQFRGTIVYQV